MITFRHREDGRGELRHLLAHRRHLIALDGAGVRARGGDVEVDRRREVDEVLGRSPVVRVRRRRALERRSRRRARKGPMSGDLLPFLDRLEPCAQLCDVVRAVTRLAGLLGTMKWFMRPGVDRHRPRRRRPRRRRGRGEDVGEHLHGAHGARGQDDRRQCTRKSRRFFEIAAERSKAASGV